MDLLGGNMILITLGTQDKGFERLLEAVDQAIEKGNIEEEVVAQIGYSKYQSKNMKIFDFTDRDKMEKWVEKCNLLITHGGVGSIIAGLNHKKPIIAAARLKKYGEHTNDHQKQIIREFVKDKYIIELKNFKKLEEAIIEARQLKPKKYQSNTNHMIKLIEDFIETH